jgi:hypothetical protein
MAGTSASWRSWPARDGAAGSAGGDHARAAQLLGVDDDLGTIEPGKLADVVAVRGDPYDLATLAERIDGVWLAGRRAV